jgi:death-on-curing protein
VAGKELRYVSVQQVADIHEKLLARDGGLPGYRAGVSLASVLDRVKNNLLYGSLEQQDPVTTAALTTYAITVGHTFNDANKRTGMSVGLVLLKLNEITAEPDGVKLREMIKAAAAGKVDQDTFIKHYIELLKTA